MNNNNITIRPPSVNCGVVCEKILRALPDWFGIEASLIQYVKDDDDVVGFLTIKKHFSETAEIHCMGILPQYHRKGIGKLLIKELENYLKDDGLKILQVKTVSADRDCSAYAKTRAFYKAVGFIPLEVFPTFFNNWNIVSGL